MRRRNGALIDPDESLDDQGEDGEEEGQEGEGLEGVFLATASLPAWVSRAAREVVVVLGFEDDSCEPSGTYVSFTVVGNFSAEGDAQVRVDQVESDPMPVEAFVEGRNKWWKEECNACGCLII